jgi:beta-xylosidase
MGLFTRNDIPIPKPSLNAFVFLKELKGGRRLNLTSSNDPIDGLAVLMPDGAIRLVLTNYDEDLSRQPYRTDVLLQLRGVPKAQYVCTRHWAADEKNGNTYGAWEIMGKPAYTDADAKRKLQQAIQYGKLAPPDVQSGPDNSLELNLTVPSPGIRFLELRPKR